ncbi:hypothetical protein [Caulobacter sp. NIBR1757]|uniref:hypothetical protein n=1 Tax=Caulobacter sp. NIBR1757 TaxID=3016000 RepID=UPI0022F0EE2C|nr:hypothetical protein [Caulobacter sp. NIBR1757]WGM39272.1 hypothetical protein AMEJIAPC_02189 [Caulobacter sp. NIBR1757]
MRAVCLALALVLSAPAASAADAGFIASLAARGPQDLWVAQGLIPSPPDYIARAAVVDGVLVIEIQPGRDAPAQVFRYDGQDFERNDVWSDSGPDLEIGRFCKGKGTASYLEIACYSRSALRSRALRPPHTVWKLWLSEDGLRIVRQGALARTVLTPLKAQDLPANLGNALSQLAAHEKGALSGGSSGGGDWYASDLRLRQVRGLDFVLERTVWPGRGGRSDQVPATWAFDYQGMDSSDPQTFAWRMARSRKGVKAADFWCVGKAVPMRVAVACHRGGRPSDVRGKPDVSFTLEPFPQWKIHVEDGADNPFDSVGTSRLEPLPFP